MKHKSISLLGYYEVSMLFSVFDMYYLPDHYHTGTGEETWFETVPKAVNHPTLTNLKVSASNLIWACVSLSHSFIGATGA